VVSIELLEIIDKLSMISLIFIFLLILLLSIIKLIEYLKEYYEETKESSSVPIKNQVSPLDHLIKTDMKRAILYVFETPMSLKRASNKLNITKDLLKKKIKRYNLLDDKLLIHYNTKGRTKLYIYNH